MTPTQRLTAFIDRFYVKPFRTMMPKQTFRYLACGGINAVITTICFWSVFNLVLGQRHLHFGPVVIASYTVSVGIAWAVSTSVGFWMQKNISFKNSPLKGRAQLFRYFLNSLAALLITWLLEKLFVEVWYIYPSIAFAIIYLITATIGFVVQKHFAFRGAAKE